MMQVKGIRLFALIPLIVKVPINLDDTCCDLQPYLSFPAKSLKGAKTHIFNTESNIYFH